MKIGSGTIYSGAFSSIFIGCLLLSYSIQTSADTLKGIRMYNHPSHTRVVLDVSELPSYEVFVLSNPERVVVDLEKIEVVTGFEGPAVDPSGIRVKGFRSARRGENYRVVLDLAEPVSTRSFTLAPVAPYGYRLVIDLRPSLIPPKKPQPGLERNNRRDVVIAIDAGHGGEDPGAVGPKIGKSRVLEKNVVLNISRKLGDKLERAKGYKSILTRQGDYYVPLRKRVEISRQARADIFISIHADAFRNSSVSGASVYTLSEQGASSENARWLAEKENRSDLIGGVGEVSLEDKDDALAHLLLDLSMDANRSASIKLGHKLLERLSHVGKIHKRGLEQAGFAVLKSPDVPSVLVETGYISNPNEARRLSSSKYQDQVSSALFEGIKLYMEEHAPPGTWIAWKREQEGIRYVVVSGDTISEIALRYGTSVQRIKKANDFNSDFLRVGQTILIPSS